MHPPFYVRLPDPCLHLRFSPNLSQSLPQRKDALILTTVEVTDVQALYAEFEGRNVEFTRGGRLEQAWGGRRTYHVRDPDEKRDLLRQYRGQQKRRTIVIAHCARTRRVTLETV